MAEFHEGDIVADFIITVTDGGDNFDLSAATTTNFVVEKPDSSVVTWTASFDSDGTDGVLKYTTVSGDLDMVGIWSGRAMGDAGYHKFNQDGTFTVAWNYNDLDSNPSASAEFWFEDTIFHVNDGCGQGTYKVVVHLEAGDPKSMKFELIDDSCEGRVNDWKSGMRWVGQ